MRHLLFALGLLALATNAAAQNQTLIKGDVAHGGFGGPVTKFTTVNDQAAIMVGGQGGWIINHSLRIGGGGYGLVNEVDAADGSLPNEGALDLLFGYGGFEAEYLFHPRSLAHLGIHTLVGGGSTSYLRDVGSFNEREQTGQFDPVFVFEPGVTAELNVIAGFRVSAGVSYRLVRGVEQNKLENGDLSGIAATIAFKFGKF